MTSLKIVATRPTINRAEREALHAIRAYRNGWRPPPLTFEQRARAEGPATLIGETINYKLLVEVLSCRARRETQG